MEPEFDVKTFRTVEIVLNIGLIGSLTCMGVVANLVNIIVFYRQGIMSHSCTVCLTGISLSDFFYSLFSFWGAVCMYIYHFDNWQSSGWDPMGFVFNLADRPAVICMEITSVLTTFVTFERCFSVVFPFKVKLIFTPKRSCAFILIVFVVVFGIRSADTFRYFLAWKKNPETNATMLGFYKVVHFPKFLDRLVHVAPSIFQPVLIVTVVVCNMIISWKVLGSQKFRLASVAKRRGVVVSSPEQDSKTLMTTTTTTTATTTTATTTPTATTKTTTTTKEDKHRSSNKELRLVRMITTVSIMFCFCYTVFFLTNFVLFTLHEQKVLIFGVHYGKQVNDLVLLINFVVQATNASCNIFIYYVMSTSYRATLQLCLSSGKR